MYSLAPIVNEVSHSGFFVVLFVCATIVVGLHIINEYSADTSDADRKATAIATSISILFVAMAFYFSYAVPEPTYANTQVTAKYLETIVTPDQCSKSNCNPSVYAKFSTPEGIVTLHVGSNAVPPYVTLYKN